MSHLSLLISSSEALLNTSLRFALFVLILFHCLLSLPHILEEKKKKRLTNRIRGGERPFPTQFIRSEV